MTSQHGGITLGYIAEHLPMLNIQCDRCGRHGRYSTDASVQPPQEDITRNCPGKHDPKYAFGKCAPMMSDLRLLPRNQPKIS
jgi:hypothetical protein